MVEIGNWVGFFCFLGLALTCFWIIWRLNRAKSNELKLKLEVIKNEETALVDKINNTPLNQLVDIANDRNKSGGN